MCSKMTNNISIPNKTQKGNKGKLPFLLWVVFFFTLITCFIGGKKFLEYNISGFGWLVPLGVAVLLFLRNPSKIRFPITIWVPWIFVVVIYQIFTGTSALQRSAMLLTPLIVGMSLSTARLDEKAIIGFFKLCRYAAIALMLIVLIKTRFLELITLPFWSGLAPEVMTGAMLCVVLASRYILDNRKIDLVLWFFLATIPVIGVTRMGILAIGLSLPFSFAPMKPLKRLCFMIIMLVLGINIFYTARIQEKMFYSGGGTISDIKWNNPDFETSGRSYIWGKMIDGISEAPWFGHGANVSEEYLSAIVPGLAHPHNDWLRLLYDYGAFGAIIFAFTLIYQFLHLRERAIRSLGNIRILLYAGLSSMLVFCLFMLTDNIILYAAFFGNLQFAILGLAYGAISYQTPEMRGRRRLPRIRW